MKGGPNDELPSRPSFGLMPVRVRVLRARGGGGGGWEGEPRLEDHYLYHSAGLDIKQVISNECYDGKMGYEVNANNQLFPYALSSDPMHATKKCHSCTYCSKCLVVYEGSL